MSGSRHQETINLNNALSYTITLLVRWGLISEQEAINIEVQMLAKSASKLGSNVYKNAFINQITFDSLRRRYKRHQKLRSLNRKVSFAIVCENSLKNDSSLLASTISLPCEQCGANTSDLQLSFEAEDSMFLQIPRYQMICSNCGFAHSVDLNQKINDNVLVKTAEKSLVYEE